MNASLVLIKFYFIFPLILNVFCQFYYLIRFPPSYKWYRKSKISLELLSLKKNLIITKTNLSDTNGYRCVVQNQESKYEAETLVVVTGKLLFCAIVSFFKFFFSFFIYVYELFFNCFSFFLYRVCFSIYIVQYTCLKFILDSIEYQLRNF